MENPTTTPNKPTEPRTPLMTGLSVAYLLAPSILFVTMALIALYYAAGYTDIATDKVAVENTQKFEWDID